MGKIPGAKHHGAKFPEEQRKKRDAKIANKINNKPSFKKQTEAQPLPRKWLDMMKYKEKVEREEIEGKEKPKPKNKPIFDRRPQETEKMFFNRMDKVCDKLERQKEAEENYDNEIEMNQQGKSKMKSDKQLDEMEKKRKKMLAKKGISTKTPEEKRAEKRQRNKERKDKKKGKSGKLEDDDQLHFSDFTDKPEFGERVDAPPQLNFKPRKPVNKNKADKVNELLLNKKLKKSNTDNNSNKVNKSKKIDDRSLSQKAKLEEERERVIQAYRDIKAKQYATANKSNED